MSKSNSSMLSLVDEAKTMRETGVGTMYLTMQTDSATGTVTHTLTNWPGTFSLPVDELKWSKHNLAGPGGRRDVWFTFEGASWHGVSIGDMELCRVKRLKHKRKQTVWPLNPWSHS